MRLFTAATPPADVADHLAAALAGVPMAYRVAREAWHITLGYYGEEDPDGRIPWVRERVAGRAAPTVSLGELGNFGETLLMLVSNPDGALAPLAAALRWNDKHPDYIPHLTVGKGEPVPLAYEGPEWTINEIVLLGAGVRHEYTVLDKVSLG